MLLQHLDRSLVDTDDPAATTLGRALDPLAIHDAGRALESDLTSVQPDVSPAQVQDLSPPAARICGESEERVEPVARGLLQKDLEIIRCPDHPWLPIPLTRQLGLQRRIGGHDRIDHHGIIECLAQGSDAHAAPWAPKAAGRPCLRTWPALHRAWRLSPAAAP